MKKYVKIKGGRKWSPMRDKSSLEKLTCVKFQNYREAKVAILLYGGYFVARGRDSDTRGWNLSLKYIGKLELSWLWLIEGGIFGGLTCAWIPFWLSRAQKITISSKLSQINDPNTVSWWIV